jgi:hypothetical protein
VTVRANSATGLMGNLDPVFDDLAAKAACDCASCCTACVRFIVIFMQTQCVSIQPIYQMNPAKPATKSVVNDLIYSIYPVSKLTLYSSDRITCTHSHKRNRDSGYSSSSLYSSDSYSSDSSDSISVKTLYSEHW